MADLKPVSDYERGLLALLDDTPANHQERLMKRMKGEKVPGPKADPILKQLQEGKTKIGPTIAEAAAAMEARLPKWREDAYCIFIAHTTCKNCGMHEVRQRDPQVYLRERMLKWPGVLSNKDIVEANPFKYTPVRSISNWLLPKLRITTFHAPIACEHCFEGLTCQVKEYSTTSFQDDTASPADQLDGSVESSSLTLPAQPPASTWGEDIEMSNLLSAASFQAVSPMNFVMSPLPISQIEGERPVDAGDLNSPIAELTLANSMQMGEG